MDMDATYQDPNIEMTVRPWGEERGQDVIYNVHLKKIHHTRSEFTKEAEVDSTLPSSIQWETVKLRTIKAAKVEKLVQYLPKALEERDSLYLNIFFSTYLTFTTPETVLKLLKESYCQACNSYSESDLKLKRNIRSVFMTWLDENPSDFNQPPDRCNLRYLLEFATDVMRDDELVIKLNNCLQRFLEEEAEENDDRIISVMSEFSVCDIVDSMIQGRSEYRHITEIDTRVLSEQLTAMDAELFRRVNPQHCIGSIWSRRDKKSADVDALTVRATINQFNDVSNKVISTILWDKSLNHSSRAKIVCKWIEVAQACRERKNFSSLKAIISGLQSHPVHRLKKTWDCIPKNFLQLYADLAGIFLDDNNFETWREILIKEGTAKFAPILLSKNGKWSVKALKRRSADKSFHKKDELQSLVYGTIPYLGTFLTDLDMIDKANQDYLDDGLINFEKKRKEFEVLAQIRLLQTAAKNYQIESDPEFHEWFRNIIVLSYTEFCDLSEEIERPSSAPTTPMGESKEFAKPRILRKFFSFTAEDFRLNNDTRKKSGWFSRGSSEHGKSDSLSSNSSQDTSPSLEDSISIDSNDMSILQSCDDADKKTENIKSPTMKSSQSCSCLTHLEDISTSSSSCLYQQPSESCRIIRVALESSDGKPNSQGNVYKSLVITHQDRAPTIIKAAIAKFNLPSDIQPKDYSLCQVLSDDVLCIPDKANVYYAMSDISEPYFILKRKVQGDEDRVPPLRVRSFKKDQDQKRRSMIWLAGD